jgi:hypothetical protein
MGRPPARGIGVLGRMVQLGRCLSRTGRADRIARVEIARCDVTRDSASSAAAERSSQRRCSRRRILPGLIDFRRQAMSALPRSPSENSIEHAARGPRIQPDSPEPDARSLHCMFRHADPRASATRHRQAWVSLHDPCWRHARVAPTCCPQQATEPPRRPVSRPATPRDRRGSLVTVTSTSPSHARRAVTRRQSRRSVAGQLRFSCTLGVDRSSRRDEL